MATFTGQLISATYDAIIKTIDNDAIGGTAKQLTDGLGNVTPLYVSTTQIGIGITPTEALHVSGNIKASSSVIATTFSGDLNGTINTATTGVTQTAGDNTTKIATTAFVQESHTGKPTGSGTGGKIALWSGSGTSTVLTDSSITEESTQYLLTKDIRIFDTIPGITLQDSDSSGSASSGSITWLDNAASQRAIISLTNSILGITSKHGGINFGTNSTPAVSIDSSQNTEFFGSISSTSTITATSYIQSDSNLLVKGDVKFRNNADSSWNGGQIGSDANDSLRFAVKTAASSNVEALTLDANLKANFTGSIAIGGNATTIASFVTESDTIASNDNDTTLPTSAAVKDYVDTQVGANNELSEILANGNTTGGTKIEVNNTSSGIDLIDDAKIRLGTGNDLQIYHNGSQDRIESSSAFLVLEASNVILRNNGGSEDYAKFLGNAAVELYYNNSKKFETTSTGVSVTGALTGTSATFSTSGTPLSLNRTGGATALVELKIGGTVEGYLGADSTKSLIVFNESAAEKFSISNGGDGTFAGTISSGAITASGSTAAGVLTLESTSASDLTITTTAANTWEFSNAGNNSVYNAYSHTFKNASTTGLTINNSGNATFAGNVTAPELRLQGTGTTYLNIGNNTTGSASSDGASIGYFTGQSSLQIVQRENDAMVFSTNNTEKMRITSDGDVLMTTTSGNKLATIKGQTGNGYYGELKLGNADHSAGIIGRHISSGNTDLEFYTENYSGDGYAERMRITSGGDVFIGNSSVTTANTAIFLNKSGIITNVVASSSTDLMQFYQQNGGGLGTISRNADGICMNGNGQTNQLVVADSGNVGIGGGAINSPTSVGTFLNITGRNGIGGGTAGIVLKDYDNAAWDIWNSGGILNFRYNNGASGAGNGLSIDTTSNATFAGNVTLSQPTNGAEAKLILTSKSAAGNSRTGIVEYDADTEKIFFINESTTVAAMTSGGNVGIGTDSPTQAKLVSSYDGTVNNGMAIINTNTGTVVQNLMIFKRGTTEVGSITSNNTTTTYVTSSDYRLKENVVSMTGALDRLSQLKPSRFNFIADADKTVDGFLAHEVQEIVPEAISGEKDAMQDEEYEVSPAVYEDVLHPAIEEELDEDGNIITEAKDEWTENVLKTEAVKDTRQVPKYQGIDQSKLVPLLVGAIQELKAEIDDLKNKCNCK